MEFLYLMIMIGLISTILVMLETDIPDKPAKLIVYWVILMTLVGFSMFVGSVNTSNYIKTNEELSPHKKEISIDSTGQKDTTFFYKKY